MEGVFFLQERHVSKMGESRWFDIAGFYRFHDAVVELNRRQAADKSKGFRVDDRSGIGAA